MELFSIFKLSCFFVFRIKVGTSFTIFPFSVCKLTWIALKVNVFHYHKQNWWTVNPQAVFFSFSLNPWHCSSTHTQQSVTYCSALIGSMHFIRRWRRPPSLSRVNFAAITSRRSSSRAGGLPCSFSNTTAATRSLAGWSPTIVGLLRPWCNTNWGRHSDTAAIWGYSHKLAQVLLQ